MGAGLSSSSSTSDQAKTSVGVAVTGPTLTFNEAGGSGNAPPWSQPSAPSFGPGEQPAVTYSFKAWVVTGIVTVALAAFALWQFLASRKKKGDE